MKSVHMVEDKYKRRIFTLVLQEFTSAFLVETRRSQRKSLWGERAIHVYTNYQVKRYSYTMYYRYYMRLVLLLICCPLQLPLGKNEKCMHSRI